MIILVITFLITNHAVASEHLFFGFCLDDRTANLYVENVNYGLDKTDITVRYENVMTTDEKILNGSLEVQTFAPGPHHVKNVIGVILTCLTLNIDADKIITGLDNYSGITGRTTKRSNGDLTVIEEINPGINTDAIRQSINMIRDLDNWYVAVGGDYGITCEEIDEDKVGDYLNALEIDIILTGDVGLSIAGKMSKKTKYIEDIDEIYELAAADNKNLLFIYRSDYHKLSQR